MARSALGQRTKSILMILLASLLPQVYSELMPSIAATDEYVKLNSSD